MVLEAAKLVFDDTKKSTGLSKVQKMTTFKFLTTVLESGSQIQDQQADEIEGLRKTLKAMEEQNDGFKKELEDRIKNEEDLLQQIEELKRVIEEKETLLQATDLTSKLDEYSNKILKLTQENEAFKDNEIKINEAKEALIAELEIKRNEEVLDLQDKLRHAEEELQNTIAQISQRDKKIEDYESNANMDAQNKDQERSTLEQENRALKQEKDQLSTENQDLLGRAGTLEDSLEKIRSEKSLLQENYENRLRDLQDLLDKQNIQLQSDLQNRNALEQENQTLKQEKDQLSAEAQSLVQKSSVLEENFNKLQGEKSFLELELKNRETLFNEQKALLENGLNDQGTLGVEIITLKQENNRILAETQNLLNKSNLLEDSLVKLQNEKSLLKEDFERKLKDQQNLLDRQNGELQSELQRRSALELENQALKQEKDRLVADAENLLNNSGALGDSLSKLQSEKLQLQKEFEDKLKTSELSFNEQRSQLQSELQRTQGELESKISSQEYERVCLENKALIQQQEKLTSDLLVSHANMKDSHTREEELNQQRSRLQSELQRTQGELESKVSSQEYERVCLENKALTQQQEKLASDLLVSHANTKDSHTREEELNQQVSQLKVEVSKARGQITNMIERETYDGLLSERESLLSKSTTLEKEVSAARSHENELLEKMRVSQNNLKSSEDDLLYTKKQLQDMVAREEYTRTKLEKEALEREIAGLRTDNSIANSRLTDLETSKAESESQRDQLQQEIRDLLTKGQSAGDGTQMLIGQNQNLQARITTLEASHRKLETDNSQSEVRISQLQTELDQSKQSTQDMVSKEEYQKLKLDKEDLANKNNSLETEVDKLKDSIQELKARRKSEDRKVAYPQEKSKLLGHANVNNNQTEKSFNTTIVNESEAVSQFYKHKIPTKTKIMVFIAIIRLIIELALAIYFCITYSNMQDDKINDKASMRFCAICFAVGALFDIVYLIVAIAIIRRAKNIIQLAGRNRLVSDGLYAQLLPKTLDEPIHNGGMYSNPKINKDARDDVQLTII